MPELIDRFLFEVEGLSKVLRVARFSGREGLSELFHFDIIVTCEDESIGCESVVGKDAVLTMQGDNDEPRYVHGVVARFEQGDIGKKLAMYRVTLVPKAFTLEHRSDIRIFQGLTAPEIIKQVLEGAGLMLQDDFRLSLKPSYRTREYCVQHRESDWAFVSRLMEDEGIFYYFEHEEGKHVLVLGDAPSAHEAIAGEATIDFRPPLGALSRGEHVSRFQYSEAIGTGAVTLRDYNFKKPSLVLEGSSSAPPFEALAVYDYPGEHETPGDGAAIAKVRLEERAAQRKVGDGESGVARLVPGHTFTLSDHTREAFNRTWLVVSSEHQGTEPVMGEVGGNDSARYENVFRVIPNDVPFRPPRVTPKPSVRGLQSAMVVGPDGEEIHTDEHGRVKVQFHWDRAGKKDDKSSCWIRVSQAWGGAGWGAMNIPRVKQEVLVDFLDGDPDRPIIVGRVYNGTNVPPYALPSDKTMSTVKSRSTPSGTGSNEIRFEDKKGSEELYLHAQKDWTIAAENDKNQTVGRNETLKIGNDKTIEVGNDQAKAIGRDEAIKVGNNRSKSVGNDESQSIGNDRTLEIGHDLTERVGNNLALSVAKAKTEEVTEDSDETVGKSRTLAVGEDYTIEVGKDMRSTVSGSLTEEVSAEVTLKAGSKIVFKCGSAVITIESSGAVTVEGSDITVKSSGAVKVEATGKVDIKGSGPMDVNASGPVKIKGATLGLN